MKNGLSPGLPPWAILGSPLRTERKRIRGEEEVASISENDA